MLLLVTLFGCAAEVSVDVDEDGDGLLSGNEATLGTDPDLADTDGDGIDDGEELRAHTDPVDKDSYPYLGGWEIGSCAGEIEGEGMGKGDISTNFTMVDSNDQNVQLYSFCDKVVYLVFAAFW